MNYASLVTMMQEYLLNDEATFVTNIPNFVASAENDIYQNTQIPALRQASTASFTASNEYLTLPSDFLAPYSLAVVVSGTSTYLLEKEDDYIRAAYPTRATTGVPKFYAIIDDESLIVGPTPALAYTAELHYFFKPSSISVTSTSWLGDNAPNALLYGSLLHGYGYMKGDQDMLTYYQNEYTRALSNLQILTEGRVRKDTYRTPNQKAPV